MSDRGPGLYREQRDHLFEPFFSTKPQGMGMGLAISRSIVESHGGRLSVQTPAGGGCVFELTLPIE